MSKDHEKEQVIQRVSYWLVPAEPDKSRLARMIYAFAQRFGAPRFEPHLTLYSGPLSAEDDVAAILEAAIGKHSALTLDAVGVAHSVEFAKTLFIDFAPSEELQKLSDQLKRLSRASAEYELNPHLSLLYADLSSELKAELAGNLMHPPSIAFDVVKAIAINPRTQTRTDVEAWRVIGKRTLVAANC